MPPLSLSSVVAPQLFYELQVTLINMLIYMGTLQVLPRFLFICHIGFVLSQIIYLTMDLMVFTTYKLYVLRVFLIVHLKYKYYVMDVYNFILNLQPDIQNLIQDKANMICNKKWKEYGFQVIKHQFYPYLVGPNCVVGSDKHE